MYPSTNLGDDCAESYNHGVDGPHEPLREEEDEAANSRKHSAKEDGPLYEEEDGAAQSRKPNAGLHKEEDEPHHEDDDGAAQFHQHNAGHLHEEEDRSRGGVGHGWWRLLGRLRLRFGSTTIRTRRIRTSRTAESILVTR